MTKESSARYDYFVYEGGRKGDMKEYGDILTTYLRVTQHMSQQFRRHFGRLQLTFPQALVLNVLGRTGPIPISELAEQTGSANSTVSGIVDRLEKLGLAKRKRSERDRRVIYVSATERYHTTCFRAKADVGGYFTAMLDGMTEDEKDEVLAALQKLDAALCEYEGKGE